MAILNPTKYFQPDIAQGCTRISVYVSDIAIAIRSTARQREYHLDVFIISGNVRSDSVLFREMSADWLRLKHDDNPPDLWF